MQLTSVATPAVPKPAPCLIGPDAIGNPGPIGNAHYGTVRIGHALNGIAYTEHRIDGPMAKPFGQYTGSLQDAITSAQTAIKELETRADGRVAVALLGMPGRWNAQLIYTDQTVLRAIDNGAGHGGIASIQFTDVSRSMGALVTSGGSLLPGQLR
jgi:hypothetical protein